MPARPRRRSASCSTPAGRTASARSMKARPRWTGWSRSRSAASPSRRRRRPAPGATSASTSLTRPATSTLPPRWSARCGCSTARSPCLTRSTAYSRSRKKLGADFEHAIDTIRKRLNAKPVAIQIPIGQEDKFRGVVDLIGMKAIVWKDETMGAEYVTEPIPAELQKKAEAFHTQLVETVAENDDEILHKFLEGEEISAEALRASLRKSTIALKLFPVVVGTAFKNKGVQPLLDAVVDYLPSPLDTPETRGIDPNTGKQITRKADDQQPFSALAFKIMADPFVGQLTFIRVYSGQLKSGESVLNSRTLKTERIGRLLKMHANKREDIQEILAGDICAVVGLKNVGTGDTICDERHPITLESIEFAVPV